MIDLDDIYVAIAAFKDLNGRSPMYMYLGHEEHAVFMNDPVIKQYNALAVNGSVLFHGIEVIEVCQMRHFNLTC